MTIFILYFLQLENPIIFIGMDGMAENATKHNISDYYSLYIFNVVWADEGWYRCDMFLAMSYDMYLTVVGKSLDACYIFTSAQNMAGRTMVNSSYKALLTSLLITFNENCGFEKMYSFLEGTVQKWVFSTLVKILASGVCCETKLNIFLMPKSQYVK